MSYFKYKLCNVFGVQFMFFIILQLKAQCNENKKLIEEIERQSQEQKKKEEVFQEEKRIFIEAMASQCGEMSSTYLASVKHV